MVFDCWRSACSVAMVLTLLIGMTVTAPAGAPRCQCPPDCPMHAHGPTCHHAKALSCHQAGGGPGVRSACGQASASTPLLAVRAVLPGHCSSRPVFASSALLLAPEIAMSHLALEPPTDPPRASLA